jgi:hypothetical protein
MLPVQIIAPMWIGGAPKFYMHGCMHELDLLCTDFVLWSRKLLMGPRGAWLHACMHACMHRGVISGLAACMTVFWRPLKMGGPALSLTLRRPIDGPAKRHFASWNLLWALCREWPSANRLSRVFIPSSWALGSRQTGCFVSRSVRLRSCSYNFRLQPYGLRWCVKLKFYKSGTRLVAR